MVKADEEHKQALVSAAQDIMAGAGHHDLHARTHMHTM